MGLRHGFNASIEQPTKALIDWKGGQRRLRSQQPG